ncbi:MFS transporter [Nocardia xishanensis]|uniref:MFS transporter n=1 Tax=Nocardia xishanensis TaxID=238964 RepID=A0ABW7XAS7_9NOCA
MSTASDTPGHGAARPETTRAGPERQPMVLENTRVHAAETGACAEPMPLGAWRRRVVLLTLCAVAFMITEDTAMQTIAVQTLLRQLGHRPDLTISMWLPTAHVVAYVALLLGGGALADRLGAKRVMVGGYLIYLVGVALHVCFPSIPIALLVARTTMGVGAAAILPASLAMVVLVYGEGSRRARAVTAWAGCSTAGVMVAMLVTAVILNQVWWPNVLVAVMIANLIVLVGVLTAVPAVAVDPASPIDWPAILTMVGSGGLLALGLHQAVTVGFTSPLFLATMLLGGALAVVAARIRRGGSLPHDWLVSAAPRVRLVMLALGCAVLSMFGMVFLVIQYLQVLGGEVPVVAGLALFLPTCLATAVGAKIGAAFYRGGCAVVAVIIGSTAIMDGLAIGLTAGEPGDLIPLVAMATVTSLGCALVLGIALEVLSAANPTRRTGVRWAAKLVLVQLCGLCGVAIVNGLVAHGYAANFVVPAAVQAVGGVDVGHDPVGDGVRAVSMADDRLGVPLAIALRNAFVAGYRGGLLATIGVVAVVMVVMLVAVALNRKSKTGPLQ